MSRLQQARENSLHDRPMLLFVDLDLPVQIELKGRPAIGVRRRDILDTIVRNMARIRSSRLKTKAAARSRSGPLAIPRLHIGRQLRRSS